MDKLGIKGHGRVFYVLLQILHNIIF